MMIIPIKKEEEKVQRDAVEWALAVQRWLPFTQIGLHLFLASFPNVVY